ncbi:hypothetical protein [Thiolapillus sp.]
MKTSVVPVLRGPFLILLSVMGGLVFTGGWLWKETGNIEATRTSRAAVKSAILQDLRDAGVGRIIGTGLDSHCGKAVLSVRTVGQNGRLHHYRYDVDTGEPISGDWWKRCMKIR